MGFARNGQDKCNLQEIVVQAQLGINRNDLDANRGGNGLSGWQNWALLGSQVILWQKSAIASTIELLVRLRDLIEATRAE